MNNNLTLLKTADWDEFSDVLTEKKSEER